jgi:hypothetical protein
MEKKKSIFSGIPSGAPQKGGGGLNGSQPLPPPPPQAAPRQDNSPEIAALKTSTQKLHEENAELRTQLKELREAVGLNAKKTQAAAEMKDLSDKDLSDKLDALTDDFLSFTRDENGAGKKVGEFDAARRKALRELEKIKEDYGSHLKKFESKLSAADKKADHIVLSVEALEDDMDRKLDVLKEEITTAINTEDKRVLALIKSVSEKVAALERECQIAIKNKLLLLESKTGLVETLSKRLEGITARLGTEK